MGTTIAFGEVLWDLLPGSTELGGAPFNFAYRLQALGTDVMLASRVGCDNLGRQVLSRLQDCAMAPTLMQLDKLHATGTVQITFDLDRKAQIAITPSVAYDYIECEDRLLLEAANSTCICFGTVAQRTPVSRNTLEQMLEAAPAALKVFDINLRKDCFTDSTICKSLQHCDMVKLNEDEVDYLSQMLELGSTPLWEFCDRLIEQFGIACCVVTLEDRGAFAATDQGERAYFPAFRVGFADPLGAGDAFTAGFVSERLSAKPLGQCLKLGNAMGAIVASQRGATAPLTAGEVRRTLDYGQLHGCDDRLVGYAVGDAGITGPVSCD